MSVIIKYKYVNYNVNYMFIFDSKLIVKIDKWSVLSMNNIKYLFYK